MIQPIMQRFMPSSAQTPTTQQADLTQYGDALYWRLADMYGAASDQPCAIGITSCSPQEGVSTVAASLAISAA